MSRVTDPAPENVAAGTIPLETALAGTPFVMAYRTHPAASSGVPEP